MESKPYINLECKIFQNYEHLRLTSSFRKRRKKKKKKKSITSSKYVELARADPYEALLASYI